MPNGIPSHDTFNRPVAALAPKQFQACFVAWMKALAQILTAQIIAIDGKTVRSSHDHDNSKDRDPLGLGLGERQSLRLGPGQDRGQIQ